MLHNLLNAQVDFLGKPVPALQVVIGDGVVNHLLDHLRDIFSERTVFGVVADETTMAIAGNEIIKELHCKSVILPRIVKPELKVVNAVQEEAAEWDVLIALGSGVINDICKYASYRLNKPYVVFGTAPSMNGYASANASVIDDGYRVSRNAHLPRAIFLDLDILCAAPERMIASGIADVMCRMTCQADWYLSHTLLDTSYTEQPFQWLLPYEAILLREGEAARRGDREVMRVLAEALIVSGLGMFACNGSYPASQGEHMIAHAIEMCFPAKIDGVLHGEMIARTTQTMLDRQRRIVQSKELPRIVFHSDTSILSLLKPLLPESHRERAIRDYREKLASQEVADALSQRLQAKWPALKKQLEGYLLHSTQWEALMHKISPAFNKSGYHLTEQEYNTSVSAASLLRNRLTFLDLEVEN